MFDIGQRVEIVNTGQAGKVISRLEGARTTDQYLIEIDGKAKARWKYVDQLGALAEEVADPA